MSVQKSADFIADVERQFEWYCNNAGSDIAERYLAAVEATSQLLSQHPLLGPQATFTHPRLRHWRFFVVFHPFKKHILFYETTAEQVIMRRAMHGHRNLPKRVLQPP